MPPLLAFSEFEFPLQLANLIHDPHSLKLLIQQQSVVAERFGTVNAVASLVKATDSLVSTITRFLGAIGEVPVCQKPGYHLADPSGCAPWLQSAPQHPFFSE